MHFYLLQKLRHTSFNDVFGRSQDVCAQTEGSSNLWRLSGVYRTLFTYITSIYNVQRTTLIRLHFFLAAKIEGGPEEYTF